MLFQYAQSKKAETHGKGRSCVRMLLQLRSWRQAAPPRAHVHQCQERRRESLGVVIDSNPGRSPLPSNSDDETLENTFRLGPSPMALTAPNDPFGSQVRKFSEDTLFLRCFGVLPRWVHSPTFSILTFMLSWLHLCLTRGCSNGMSNILFVHHRGPVGGLNCVQLRSVACLLSVFQLLKLNAA